jgi:hypothetical protein
MKKLVGILVVLLLASPLAGVVSVAAIATPTAITCSHRSLVVGEVPGSLAAKTGERPA